MQPVSIVEGIAAPLHRENIDTDIIIPSREITSPSRAGFGSKAFAPWRYRSDGSENPDFVLNKAPWRQATMLIAGANFGCGSSREMAVWALWQFGIRAIIAPSFGAIFRDNCVRNSLVPIELTAQVIATLAAAAEREPLHLVVDLPAGVVKMPDGTEHAFALEALDREMLITGMDAIDRTWQWRESIEAFEQADRQHRPWMWST